MAAILAYFKDEITAAEAKEALGQLGIKEMQIDRISTVPYTLNNHLNNPLANEANTISGLVQADGNDIGGDVGVLLPAGPAASGYGGDPVMTRNYLLTVVTSEKDLEKANAIIKQYNGMI